MELEQWEPSLIQDPMVEEAGILELSWKKIIDDKVLAHYTRYLLRIAPEGSEIKAHGEWLMSVFPELAEAGNIPHPWVWADLVVKADNIGDLDGAETMCKKWIAGGSRVAYWTGGLEFTRAHYEVAKFLFRRQMKILLGVEPFCYPNESSKGRGAMAEDIVPVSFWSKLLKEDGFVFNIPRPLPSGLNNLSVFYNDLYAKITAGQAEIVISDDDLYLGEKLKRGKSIVVPHFSYPSTTELWNSFFTG